MNRKEIKDFLETLHFHGYIDHDITKLDSLIDNYYPKQLQQDDVSNSILSELKQELEWYNEDEAKTDYTKGVKIGRQQAMKLAMEVIQKYCS